MDDAKRAVVIGASMAGLLAARALTDHFEQVVIVERDRLPEHAAFRKGVPQSRHVHVLLARGAQILEQLFPGFRTSLIGAGAQPIDWTRDVLWLGAAGWGTRFPHSLEMLSSHRELLEHWVRRRVLAFPRVRLIEEHDVIDIGSTTGGAVTGVQLRPRPGGEVQHVRADLVVDASGRNSRSPEFLASMGYAAPRQTIISSFLGYASREYRPPRRFDVDWRALFLMPRAPNTTRSGGLFPIDGDRWIVTLAGVGRDYPATDPDAFLEFARSLRSPILYRAISLAQPLTSVTAYRRTENQWRYYDELSRWPDNFVILGDAVCAFNPIYGQGMTVAAESALLLQRWVNSAQPAHAFQKALAKDVIATPWLLATGEDFRFPSTEGGRPTFATRLAHRYFDRLLEVSTVDETVAQTFIRVLHLLAPPSVLFRPRILFRALRGPRRPLLTEVPTATPLDEPVAQPV